MDLLPKCEIVYQESHSNKESFLSGENIAFLFVRDGSSYLEDVEGIEGCGWVSLTESLIIIDIWESHEGWR